MSTWEYLGKMLKSKMVWLGIIITIIPYAAAYLTNEITLFGAVVNSFAGILVIGLRLITNKPIAEKTTWLD